MRQKCARCACASSVPCAIASVPCAIAGRAGRPKRAGCSLRKVVKVPGTRGGRARARLQSALYIVTSRFAPEYLEEATNQWLVRTSRRRRCAVEPEGGRKVVELERILHRQATDARGVWSQAGEQKSRWRAHAGTVSNIPVCQAYPAAGPCLRTRRKRPHARIQGQRCRSSGAKSLGTPLSIGERPSMRMRSPQRHSQIAEQTWEPRMQKNTLPPLKRGGTQCDGASSSGTTTGTRVARGRRVI